MPRAIDVSPKKWQNIRVLFDDGIYSVCWGIYDGTPCTMGKRWNDNYPRQGSSSTWYIEYDYFVKQTLNTLITDYESRKPLSLDEEQYLINCRIALRDLEESK